MRKLLIACSLVAMLFGVAVSAAAPTNFSGTWVLDKTKSEGLPRNYESAESVTLTVTQDDKQISVDTKVVQGAPPAGGAAAGAPGAGAGGAGGGGRGGGMGGGGGMAPGPAVYKLDGSETTTEANGRTSKSKAKWLGDTKLELSRVTEFTGPNGAMTTTSTDTWELADGGKTLKIARKSESTRGVTESKLTFTKK